MKLKVSFCRLDARDDVYTGYRATGFSDKNGYFREVSQEQGLLTMELEREYLTALHQLQTRLAAKYESLLAQITSATYTPEEEIYADGLTERRWKQHRKLLELQYPGNEAEYYT